MTFKLAPKTEITMSVDIVETQENGKVENYKCKATFKRLSTQEWQRLCDRILDKDTTWQDALSEYTLNITDITDENDEPVPFDDDLLDRAIEYPPMFAGLLEAFTSLNAGRKEEERRKNLKKPGGTGR